MTTPTTHTHMHFASEVDAGMDKLGNFKTNGLPPVVNPLGKCTWGVRIEPVGDFVLDECLYVLVHAQLAGYDS